MPITPTYPGVYIEEIPSGVRTITGVSTSVTAFVGYTRNGPVNKAEEILSFADFERKFGGLTKDSPLSYAVQHYFMNGGQQAYVVRLANNATEAAITLNSFNAGVAEPALRITAREPSARANGVVIGVDYDTAHPDSTFNLRVEDPGTGRAEEFLGLTMNSRSRRNVDNVINDTSQLIEVKTDADALADVATGKGESVSGGGISHTVVDATHRQFMITLDEEDGPKPVMIYDGSDGNRPTSLGDPVPTSLISKITAAVQAIDPGREPYKSFKATASNGVLTLTSGETGDGSFVRVTSAGTFDASSVLKLGVANGGREIDAAAGIRPAPVGTSSGNLQQIPAFSSNSGFSSNRKVSVTIDGDGPHEVSVFRSSTDAPPTNLNALRLLLRERLRQVKPNQSGSMAFMGIEADVVGDSIQILSGSEDENSLVQFENLPILESLNSVSFVSATDGWAVGDNGTILHFQNNTWTKVDPVPQGVQDANLHGVHFVDANNGWVVGEGGTILRFQNNTWTRVTLPNTIPETTRSASLHGVHFVDANNGWVVGEGGTILRFQNNAWTRVDPMPQGAQNAYLRAVFAKNKDVSLAVGDNGIILRFQNNTWTRVTLPNTIPETTRSASLRGVFLASVGGSTKAWVVGYGGTILFSEKAGDSQETTPNITWVAQDPKVTPTGPSVTANLSGVHFFNASNGWAVGEGGTILKTTDGTEWAKEQPQNLPTTPVLAPLRGVHFFNASNAWAVGEGGSILRFASNWSVQSAVDTSADALKLTTTQGSQNVKAYTLGVGNTRGAQSGAAPGQNGQLPLAADFQGSEDKKSGIYALLDVDLFTILCLPGVTDLELNDAVAILSEAVPFCERRRAFCIIDCPESWTTFDDAIDHLPDFNSVRSKNAAMYFPRVQMPDPLDDNRLRTFPPSGIVAGIYARTDATRGVWKAPAGQEASLTGVRSLTYKLTDRENGLLNPLGLNCLRIFPVVGPVNWGARTLHGADVLASEWKYIPVRRLALFLEESLYRGMQWVVFEPNDEPLWAQIRLNVGAFMHNLFRQGAFQGTSPRDAYFVRCDKETTTQNDIDRGIVNVLVGFAPLKPAEFVIVKIQQMAGQIQT